MKGKAGPETRGGWTEHEVTIDTLRSRLGNLQETLDEASISGEHLIPDLCVVGFARDVLEYAKAVAILWESDVPHAAFAPARSAFEACQDLMYLATRADDYDEVGARAAAGELLDWKEARRLAEEIPDSTMPEMTPPADQLEANAAAWDRFGGKGKGDILRRAWTAVAEDRTKKRRYHWSGFTRQQLPEKFAKPTGGDGSTAAMHSSVVQPPLDSQSPGTSDRAAPRVV